MHPANMGASEHPPIKFPTWVLNKLSQPRIKMEAYKFFTTVSSQAGAHGHRPVDWTRQITPLQGQGNTVPQPIASSLPRE